MAAFKTHSLREFFIQMWLDWRNHGCFYDDTCGAISFAKMYELVKSTGNGMCNAYYKKHSYSLEQDILVHIDKLNNGKIILARAEFVPTKEFNNYIDFRKKYGNVITDAIESYINESLPSKLKKGKNALLTKLMQEAEHPLDITIAGQVFDYICTRTHGKANLDVLSLAGINLDKTKALN